MEARSNWLRYTVIRLTLFAIPLAILLIVGVWWPISVVAAALIGLLVSYLVLGRARGRVSTSLYAVRNREHTAPTRDDTDEDAILDAAEATDAGVTPPASDDDRGRGRASAAETASERVGGAEDGRESQR